MVSNHYIIFTFLRLGIFGRTFQPYLCTKMLSLEHNTSRYQKLLCPIKFIKTVLSTISVGTRSFCAQNQIQKVSLNKSDFKSFINTAVKGQDLEEGQFFL
uniref:Uncharacterized protein n=1 Tax=Cacopsylla melanoneura TaxID=428564 RepID=A0A8D8M4S1_9HEMI